MESSAGQEHIPPWTYRDLLAGKRMTAQLVSAPGNILQGGVQGPSRCQEGVRLTSSRGQCYYSWLHPVQEALSWSWGAEVLQCPRISHIQQEFLTHSRELQLLSSKGKTHKKDVSLRERNDQWNHRLCSAATWSCGISMYSPLWVSIKNQHCHVSKIKLFRSEFPVPLRHKKTPWQQLLSTSYSSFLLRIMIEKQFIDLC